MSLKNLEMFTEKFGSCLENHIVLKNCGQQQNKLYRKAQRRASCFAAPMRQKSLSGQISKKLIASLTNRIQMHRQLLVASLRFCIIRRYQNKSDRITLNKGCRPEGTGPLRGTGMLTRGPQVQDSFTVVNYLWTIDVFMK